MKSVDQHLADVSTLRRGVDRDTRREGVRATPTGIVVPIDDTGAPMAGRTVRAWDLAEARRVTGPSLCAEPDRSGRRSVEPSRSLRAALLCFFLVVLLAILMGLPGDGVRMFDESGMPAPTEQP